MASNLRESLVNYVRTGYIIVQQNVRGTYLSQGEFVNVPPIKEIEGSGMLIATTKMSDTYDTVEWLLANTENNGKVGVKGVSYPGFYANCAALSGHPAIKAVSPQAPVTDWFIGDDLHHNGALMLSDTYHFGRFFFRKRPHPSSRILPTVRESRRDIYRFFQRKGAISSILGPLAKKRSFFKDIVSHPNYDSFWQERNAASALKERKDDLPAMMIVGGTFDAEDCYGPLECFRNICDRDDAYLVLGPWAHGSWNHPDFDHLADASLRPGLSKYYLDSIEYPFFAHYLEDKDEAREGGAAAEECPENGRAAFEMEKVQIFPSEAISHEHKAKRSRWKNPLTETLRITSDSWPLRSTRPARFYLTGTKRLSDIKPKEEESKGTPLSYISNPLKPVPATSPAPYIDKDYMAADQKFASRRKDVLTFRGPKMKGSMVICGPVKVCLNVAVSSTDADIVVKLIDVRPDGYQMLVRGDIMPLRFRKSFEKPQALSPDEQSLVKFTMNDVFHILKPGHKLMVQVQSSWYPLFAANPQKFLKNPYLAEKKDYSEARITVFPGESYIELQVL